VLTFLSISKMRRASKNFKISRPLATFTKTSRPKTVTLTDDFKEESKTGGWSFSKFTKKMVSKVFDKNEKKRDHQIKAENHNENDLRREVNKNMKDTSPVKVPEKHE
jgi:hypothetical protein